MISINLISFKEFSINFTFFYFVLNYFFKEISNYYFLIILLKRLKKGVWGLGFGVWG